MAVAKELCESLDPGIRRFAVGCRVRRSKNPARTLPLHREARSKNQLRAYGFVCVQPDSLATFSLLSGQRSQACIADGLTLLFFLCRSQTCVGSTDWKAKSGSEAYITRTRVSIADIGERGRNRTFNLIVTQTEGIVEHRFQQQCDRDRSVNMCAFGGMGLQGKEEPLS